MKNFCIITNSRKDKDMATAKAAKEFLESQGCEVKVFDNVDAVTNEYVLIDPKEIPEACECIMTIGGDGTLLHAVKGLNQVNCVFVGLNKGNMGFLAEISMDDMEESLKKLLDGDFKEEERMMLKATLVRDGKEIQSVDVLNDVVLHRGAEISVSNYIVHVNGELLNRYTGDGIIVATPTGSTAYNYSAGGPLARPDSHLMIMTPICSHALGSRSIIFSKNDVLEIEIGEDRKYNQESRCLSMDGDEIIKLEAGDVVKIEPDLNSIRIAKLDDSSFVHYVRSKIR